jgi:hypothetical protein
MARSALARRVAPLWFAGGLIAALLLNWQFRDGAAGDTANYLEMASKYAHRQFAEAIVLYWSPGFAWLLLPVAELPRRLQLHAAHALQVALLGLALCAAWQLTESIRFSTGRFEERARALVLGTTLTAALVAAPARYITPDVAALAIVLWLFARVIRETATDHPSNMRRAITGGVWGAAYLCRTYVAPFGGLVLLAASVLVRRNRRVSDHARWLAPYVVGFLVVGGPWMAVLSLREGRPTWGESGRNNIVAALDREVVEPPAWPRLLASGRVHDFERPFHVAVPESYDVDPTGTYRYTHIWRNYARILAGNVEALFFGFYPPDMALFWPLGILGVLAWVAFLPPTSSDPGRAAGPRWLLICGVMGIAMFVAVHVESRYVAPFLVVIAAAIAWRVQALPDAERAPLARVLSLVGLLFCVLPFLVWADGLRSSRAPRVGMLDADVRWLASHGKRFAVAGSTYDLGMAAWVSERELIASVNVEHADANDCAAIEQALRGLRIDAVVAARGTAGCGPWRNDGSSNWTVWTLGVAPVAK